MSELISKETLLNEIVNTPTNSDCYNSAYQTYTTAYHSGSATRQLEILDIINKLPTINEQEIRNKAIEEFIERIEERLLGVHPDELYCGYTAKGIANICMSIAEQLKEVGE